MLSLLYLTGSALTTGTLMHMADGQSLLVTKGVELCSYLCLLCGNHFDLPFLYFPCMIVFVSAGCDQGFVALKMQKDILFFTSVLFFSCTKAGIFFGVAS